MKFLDLNGLTYFKSKLKGYVDGLITTLDSSISTLNSKISTNTSDINNLTTKYNNLSTTVSDNSTNNTTAINEAKALANAAQVTADSKVGSVTLVKDPNNSLKYTLNVDGNTSDIDIPKDQFLKSVSYTNNTLNFVFETTTGEVPASVDLSNLIDVYTAGDGINIDNHKISISITDNDYIQITNNKLNVRNLTDKLKQLNDFTVGFRLNTFVEDTINPYVTVVLNYGRITQRYGFSFLTPTINGVKRTILPNKTFYIQEPLTNLDDFFRKGIGPEFDCELLLDCKGVKSARYAFADNNSIDKLDFTNCTFENMVLTDVTGMFAGCIALKELDIFDLEFSSSCIMTNMFERCYSLKTIYCDERYTDKIYEAVIQSLPNFTWNKKDDCITRVN